MNNSLEIDNINSQLERANIQKNRLILNINREYDHYLSIVRNLLYNSVEKGLNSLSSNLLSKDNSINVNELFCLFETKISKLIYTKLPLITVEQLKIKKNIQEKQKTEVNFNSLKSYQRTNYDQKENFIYEYGSKFAEPIQFQISEDISNTSEYYQAEYNEKFVSLDLDKNDQINYLSNSNIMGNIVLEEQLISSLLELMQEVKVARTRNSENYDINQINNSPKNQYLKNFDLIDKSLENLLLNLSYAINLELFKAKLIKNMISQDSFKYLVDKKLMIKHPNPFVINFEFNLNDESLKAENLPSIIFFNISTVELEFKNLNLSIQRNKINELKNQFQRLIKKETYWRQKEITLNKIR